MNSPAIKLRLQRHLVACSAIPGAALFLNGQSAEAAVTYIVPGTPVVIPNSFAGIYFNLETGIFDPVPGNVPGWDVNPYGSNGILMWYAGSSIGTVVGASAGTGGQVVPQTATTEFSSVTWDTGGFNLQSNPAIQGGGTFFLAFQFQDGASVTNNVWMELSAVGPGGFPAQVNRWAFAPVGEPGFVVGGTASIPEAGTSCLALLAAGAAGMRRRRAARA